MMFNKRRKVRTPSKKEITELSEAFKEIEGSFELNGFSREEAVPQEITANDAQGAEDHGEADDENGAGGDEDTRGVEYYQREDIEVAIAVFISTLVKEKVIPLRPGEHTSITEVFEKIFGEKHEITRLVKELEEHVEGYFGVIGYDDMKSAYDEILAIREMINAVTVQHAAAK